MDVNENVIKKTMPHSEDAERGILGSILLDPASAGIAMEHLIPEDFYSSRNEKLFYAMTRLQAEKKEIDIVTLKEKCDELGYAEEISNLESIRQMVMLVKSSANLESYVRIVKEKSTLRQVIKVCETLANDAYFGNLETRDLYEKMESEVFQFLQSRRGIEKNTPIDQIVVQALLHIEEAMVNGGTVTGVPTGFVDLDTILTGLHGSELILVAARPAMGKTAFVLNIAAHVVLKEKIPVALFSLEMGEEQLATRMLALESMVDSQKIRTGQLDYEELSKVMAAGDALSRSPLEIIDKAGVSVADIRSQCRSIIQKRGSLGLIIIDYLQLMSGSGRIESRQQEVAEISRGLKGLAKELNVPVIALSQLSRAVEARDDHKPRMSDLRESGSIEQDADVVMFIYRDEYYNPDTTTKQGVAEIIIGKQRSGATGTVELAWIGKHTKFANKERAKKRMQEPD